MVGFKAYLRREYTNKIRMNIENKRTQKEQFGNVSILFVISH